MAKLLLTLKMYSHIKINLDWEEPYSVVRFNGFITTTVFYL